MHVEPIVAAVRASHIPSPTDTDYCVFCDDPFPCRSLALCDVITQVQAALAVDERSSVRVAAALAILNGEP